MNRFLATLTVLALLVVGVGFYRGWFAISGPAPESADGKVNITLATDTDKLKHDVQAVKDKATELTGGSAEALPSNGPAIDISQAHNP